MTEKIENFGLEINLLALIKALLRKAWLIILVTIAMGCFGYFSTRMTVTPTYRSSFTLYVNNKTEKTSYVTSSDLYASQSLINTFSQIITSHRVLDNVGETLGVTNGYYMLRGSVSVEGVDGTELMIVNVTMTDPQLAYQVACAISEFVPDYSADIVEGTSMKIVDTPTVPLGRYSPSYTRGAIKAAAAGFILICLLICLLELMDTSINSIEKIEKQFGLAVIGTIPDFGEAKKASTKYSKK